MFKRKLAALDYHNASKFDLKDEKEFRNLVVWIEDQKVRVYKIEERGPLRDIRSGDWSKTFKKYLDHLGCPDYEGRLGAELDWLLGYAVRLEYADNVDKLRNVSNNQSTSSTTTSGASNPLDDMDFDGADFKAGVASLSQMLQIPPHQDHKIILKAVCILIKEKLSKEALERAQQKDGKNECSLPLDKMELGFETGDYISMEAAKILRLLHIRDLRDLQTEINETIVQLQALTANPKTDSRLGKVGKF